ncbi:unnamed protein product, partial [Tenebrio molitor]
MKVLMWDFTNEILSATLLIKCKVSASHPCVAACGLVR